MILLVWLPEVTGAEKAITWKRRKGKNPEGKNFRQLLRRKQSSAKISKISRNTLESSKSDIFYLLRNLLKYLLRTFFSSAMFSEVCTLCVFTLWLFLNNNQRACTLFSPEFRGISSLNAAEKGGENGSTLQPEIIAKLIPKTFFHVTEI